MPMNRDEAAAALMQLNQVIATSALLLNAERETLEQFMREAASADSILVIVDPTLWMNKDRQRANDLTQPVYRAALGFLDAYSRAIKELEEWKAERDAKNA